MACFLSVEGPKLGMPSKMKQLLSAMGSFDNLKRQDFFEDQGDLGAREALLARIAELEAQVCRLEETLSAARQAGFSDFPEAPKPLTVRRGKRKRPKNPKLFEIAKFSVFDFEKSNGDPDADSEQDEQ